MYITGRRHCLLLLVVLQTFLSHCCESLLIECPGVCGHHSFSRRKQPYTCNATAIYHMEWGSLPGVDGVIPQEIKASWSIISKQSSAVQLAVTWDMKGEQMKQDKTRFLLQLIRASAYEMKFEIAVTKNHQYEGKLNFNKIRFRFFYCDSAYSSYIEPDMAYYWTMMSLPIYHHSSEFQRNALLSLPGCGHKLMKYIPQCNQDYYDSYESYEAMEDQANKSKQKPARETGVVKEDDEDYDKGSGDDKKLDLEKENDKQQPLHKDERKILRKGFMLGLAFSLILFAILGFCYYLASAMGEVSVVMVACCTLIVLIGCMFCVFTFFHYLF